MGVKVDAGVAVRVGVAVSAGAGCDVDVGTGWGVAVAEGVGAGERVGVGGRANVKVGVVSGIWQAARTASKPMMGSVAPEGAREKLPPLLGKGLLAMRGPLAVEDANQHQVPVASFAIDGTQEATDLPVVIPSLHSWKAFTPKGT